jgi:hypothetical protein
MAIAVVDDSGVLKAFSRMDGAPLLAVAQDKAYTAAGFGLSTDGWFEFIKDDPVGAGYSHTHATCAYSWISPPSRSRRTTIPADTTAGSLGPSGGACPNERCGRCTL